MATADGGGVNGDKGTADRPESGHPAARSLAHLESSQGAMRDTTKWLVAASAAVAAVIVAGLQISEIPHGTGASSLAILGFLIALAGVAVILFAATSVLSGGYTTLGELSDLRIDPAYQRERRKEESWGIRIENVQTLLGEESASWLPFRWLRPLSTSHK